MYELRPVQRLFPVFRWPLHDTFTVLSPPLLKAQSRDLITPHGHRPNQGPLTSQDSPSNLIFPNSGSLTRSWRGVIQYGDCALSQGRDSTVQATHKSRKRPQRTLDLLTATSIRSRVESLPLGSR
jgi:hypothetical protein